MPVWVKATMEGKWPDKEKYYFVKRAHDSPVCIYVVPDALNKQSWIDDGCWWLDDDTESFTRTKVEELLAKYVNYILDSGIKKPHRNGAINLAKEWLSTNYPITKEGSV